MKDLQCQKHGVRLVLIPEDGEYRCPQSDASDPCESLTLADILMRVDGIIGYVEYSYDK